MIFASLASFSSLRFPGRIGFDGDLSEIFADMGFANDDCNAELELFRARTSPCPRSHYRHAFCWDPRKLPMCWKCRLIVYDTFSYPDSSVTWHSVVNDILSIVQA